jgi:aspartate/methionine/tyrosine aminotransferase
VNSPEDTFAEGGSISYAHWVRNAMALMRSGPPGQVSLFESSVPEPSAMLAETAARAFRFGMPSSFSSVFMRSNPDVVAHLSDRYDVPRENIRCTTGATTAVALAYGALVPTGGTVLIEHPGFDIFANCARDAGLETTYFRRDAPQFDVVPADVLGALTESTRMIVVSNLHNPSGASVSSDVLVELASALKEKNVYLLIDEVYQDYDTIQKPAIDLRRHSNVVRIGSLTKTFGLSAVRCGWMFAGGDVMKRLSAHCDRVDFGVSKLAHSVAAEVLARADEYDEWRDSIMTVSRPIAEAALKTMVDDGLIELRLPLNGCTCFPRVVGVQDTRALSRWLIARHGVVVVPGECFGMAGHIRIGFALAGDKLQAGLERLALGLRAFRDAGDTHEGSIGRAINAG